MRNTTAKTPAKRKKEIFGNRITAGNFQDICHWLMEADEDLGQVIKNFGYPPLWLRDPGFPTLVRILLEQQVSLASARAAYDKLVQKTGTLTPSVILDLSDRELRECYFSRQKTGYVRNLAMAIQNRELDLEGIRLKKDTEARLALMKIKGIGEWTADIYLLMALGRTDIFPLGDMAMVKSLIRLKKLPVHSDRQLLLKISHSWAPFRSVSTMILWHDYLSRKGISLP